MGFSIYPLRGSDIASLRYACGRDRIYIISHVSSANIYRISAKVEIYHAAKRHIAKTLLYAHIAPPIPGPPFGGGEGARPRTDSGKRVAKHKSFGIIYPAMTYGCICAALCVRRWFLGQDPDQAIPIGLTDSGGLIPYAGVHRDQRRD